jgi:hypothetical protein
MEHNKDWMMAKPAAVNDAWYVTIHGAQVSEIADVVKLFWPEGRAIAVPSKMVLMTVAAFADLHHRASRAI